MNATEGRGRKPFTEELFNKWTASDMDAVLNLIREEKKSTVYEEFMGWAVDNGEKGMNQVSFFKLLKGLTESSKAWTKEDYEKLNISVSKPKAPEFGPKEQFEIMTSYIGLMDSAICNSLYIYGGPGLGKSKETIDKLEALDTNYVLFTGGVKGPYELAKILYENRTGTVLVFDDFDSAMDKKAMKDILKAALQDDPIRQINWHDSTKRAKKDSIPEKFSFDSGIIFISNRKRIDPAIKSRSMVALIDLTMEQTLERICGIMENFMPRVPMKHKVEVHDYLKDNVNKIQRLDLRAFKHAVANYLIQKSKDENSTRWQEWTLRMLNS